MKIRMDLTRETINYSSPIQDAICPFKFHGNVLLEKDGYIKEIYTSISTLTLFRHELILYKELGDLK